MPMAAQHHNANREVKQHTRKTARSDYHHLYGRRWQAARLSFLRLQPLCEGCKPRIKQAEVVDHIADHKGDLRLFWNRKNWQPLCKSCHDSKTGRENGFGSRG
jgi:5-methylcytosine-specific restriction protein A